MANWLRISGSIAALATEITFFPFVFVFLFVYNKKKSRKIAKFITNLVLKGVFLPRKRKRRVYHKFGKIYRNFTTKMMKTARNCSFGIFHLAAKVPIRGRADRENADPTVLYCLHLTLRQHNFTTYGIYHPLTESMLSPGFLSPSSLHG